MRLKPHSALSLLVALAMVACGGMREPTAAVPAAEPATEQMLLARQVGKVGVPVEVRYQFDAAPVLDQPMTLRLALIPRVPGQNLRIEFPPAESVTVESADMRTREKVDAAGIYRQSVVVTPRTAEAAEVRVLVSLDAEGGRYFGIFSVPLSAVR